MASDLYTVSLPGGGEHSDDMHISERIWSPDGVRPECWTWASVSAVLRVTSSPTIEIGMPD